jgi:hypothetical protein
VQRARDKLAQDERAAEQEEADRRLRRVEDRQVPDESRYSAPPPQRRDQPEQRRWEDGENFAKLKKNIIIMNLPSHLRERERERERER